MMRLAANNSSRNNGSNNNFSPAALVLNALNALNALSSCLLLLLFLLPHVTASAASSIVDPSFTTTSTPLHSTTRSLIVGGHPVPTTPTPYPAFAWSGISPSDGWGCGGSLIHPDIVLTAAHCLWVFRGHGLYIGATQIDGSDGRHYADEDIVVHPNFRDEDHANDVMLIKLGGVSHVKPFEYNVGKEPEVGSEVTIVGFGMTSEDGNVSTVLREVVVNVFPYEVCKSTYRDMYPIVDDLFLCAGTAQGGRDACDSDSGAPLLVDNTVVGVTGDGIGCGRPGVPSTNARVGAYVDWIERSICELSSVPPENCGGMVEKGEVGSGWGWGVVGGALVVLLVGGGLWVGAAVVRSPTVARVLRRQETDASSYEEIPAIDMHERGLQ